MLLRPQRCLQASWCTCQRRVVDDACILEHLVQRSSWARMAQMGRGRHWVHGRSTQTRFSRCSSTKQRATTVAHYGRRTQPRPPIHLQTRMPRGGPMHALRHVVPALLPTWTCWCWTSAVVSPAYHARGTPRAPQERCFGPKVGPHMGLGCLVPNQAYRFGPRPPLGGLQTHLAH